MCYRSMEGKRCPMDTPYIPVSKVTRGNSGQRLIGMTLL